MSRQYLSRGDIVAVAAGPAKGSLGIVLGEGNAWDLSVKYFMDGEVKTGRFDKEQLRFLSLDAVLNLGSPLPANVLQFLA